MKKLSMLLLALLVAFAMVACDTSGDDGGTTEPTFTETVLLTENGEVNVSTFEGLADGSFVLIAFINNSGADRSGWGIGGIGDTFSDTNVLSITPDSLPDGGVGTADITAAAIVSAAAGETVAFNIYNDVTLTSVTLFVPE